LIFGGIGRFFFHSPHEYIRRIEFCFSVGTVLVVVKEGRVSKGAILSIRIVLLQDVNEFQSISLRHVFIRLSSCWEAIAWCTLRYADLNVFSLAYAAECGYSSVSCFLRRGLCSFLLVVPHSTKGTTHSRKENGVEPWRQEEEPQNVALIIIIFATKGRNLGAHHRFLEVGTSPLHDAFLFFQDHVVFY